MKRKKAIYQLLVHRVSPIYIYIYKHIIYYNTRARCEIRYLVHCAHLIEFVRIEIKYKNLRTRTRT